MGIITGRAPPPHEPTLIVCLDLGFVLTRVSGGIAPLFLLLPPPARFAPIPHWTASVRLAGTTELAQSAEHSFVITVDGTKSPGSVNTYVQIVGVRVWFSMSTF